MSDNSTGENSIDSLADRAKEMLERVRGTAVPDLDPDAPATVPSPTIESSPSVADETVVDPKETEPESPGHAESEVAEEIVEAEDSAREAEEVSPDELDVETEAREHTRADQVTDVVVEDVEVEGAAGEVDRPETEIHSAEVVIDDVVDEAQDEPEADAAIGLDEPIDDAIATDGDDTSTSRLGLLANKAKESLDNVAGTPTAMAAGTEDDSTIDLPEISIEPPEPEIVASAEGDSSGGFIASFGSTEASIDFDDLGDLAEADATPPTDPISAADLDTQEIDIPLPDVGDDSSTIAGASAAIAGSAVVAGTAGASAIGDEKAFGLDADLGETSEPAFSEVSPPAEPHIDSDLDDLFIESDEEVERKRAYTWLVPLGFLALAAFGLVYWLSGIAESDNGVASDDGQTQIDDTVDTDDTSLPSSTDAASSTTETTDAATTSTESTTTETTEAPLPANAWELLGEDSNTSSFAALGGPLGLQAALEQEVDENGEPLEFTLFAPSNEALQALSDDELTALAEDPATAFALVEYHFVDQRLTPELLIESIGSELQTRAGAPILVTQDGDDIVLNGEARLSLAGLESANGNVIVIDTVLQPPSVNTLLNLDNIEFEVISSVLTPASEAELQKAVTFFKDNPETTALIEGHTDTDGESDANLRLSDRRAQAVRQFLISQGIDGSRLVARGFGETEPIIVDGVEDKDASRRIEFTLQ